MRVVLFPFSLLPQIDTTCVSLSIFYREPNLIIEMTNPYEPNVEDDPLTIRTSKKDKEFHGYGRQIINEIVKKYDGVVKCKTEDRTFSLSIMLICSEKDREGEEHV